MHPKSPDFQWVLLNSAWKKFGSKNEYIQERLGWSLSGDPNWRRMGFTGPATSYKRIASEDSKTSIASISQAVSDEAYSVWSCEIGRYQEQFNGINKRNWKYLLHHGITTTAEYLHECSSGLAVKKYKRPLRVESPSTNISGFFRSKQDHK